MTRRTTSLAAVAVLIGLAVAVAAGVVWLRATPTTTVDTAVAHVAGPPAPDVAFATADGELASLADYRGQPLVLNFWASWCPPCVAEMGDAFRPVHEAHRGEVAFLGMNLQDDPEAAQRVLDATGVTYDLAVDPTGEVFAAFGGVGMPTTVFIDSEGRLVDTHTGAITREQLEQQIRALRGA